MHTVLLKNKAIELRNKGESLAAIARTLSISKSTVSLWLRSIPLSKELLLYKQSINGKRQAEVQKNKKNERGRVALLEANQDIGSISKRDLFMLGIALYIGEGTKWKNLVRIVNSDPKVIKLAVRWLIECCDVKKESIFLRIHGYKDTDFKLAEQFWSKHTGLPLLQFQKYVVDTRINKVKKQGKLPFGTLHLTVVGDTGRTVNLGLKIRKWMEVVLD